MVPTRRALVLALLGVTAFALFYPFQSIVTNRWFIAAVNVDGHPIAGCQIEQQWEWRAVGLTGREVLTTDVAGHAIFPPRTVRASLFRRVSGTIGSISWHGPASGKSVQFLGCDAKGQRADLGIYQRGESMTYTHKVPTVWRDASMLR